MEKCGLEVIIKSSISYLIQVHLGFGLQQHFVSLINAIMLNFMTILNQQLIRILVLRLQVFITELVVRLVIVLKIEFV
jgi:hypothetical protein